MCSYISVGPSSVVATGPSAVSTVVIPIPRSEGSPRAHLEHGLVPAHRSQHNRSDRRLAQETLGRLARPLPVREALHFVDQGNDAGSGRHVLASALGVGQDTGHDLGRDRRPHGGAAERADELWTVDVLGVERLPEDVGADEGNHQRRFRGNHRLVLGRRLERADARTIGLVQDAHARTPVPQAPEEIQGDAIGLAVAGVPGPDDEHLPVGGQRGRDAFTRCVGGRDVRGRQRDLRGEDAGRRGRDRAATLLHHLAGQAKHGRGFSASSDQRDDLVARHRQRIRQLQPRAPAAARSISSFAPAWIQGKKLVIATRTPIRVYRSTLPALTSVPAARPDWTIFLIAPSTVCWTSGCPMLPMWPIEVARSLGATKKTSMWSTLRISSRLRTAAMSSIRTISRLWSLAVFK